MKQRSTIWLRRAAVAPAMLGVVTFGLALGQVPGGCTEPGTPGPQGEQGPAGPAGPQGEQGPSGAVGQDGQDAPAVPGRDGDKADKGDMGDPGQDGVDGEKGDKGDMGDPGQDGVDGEKGDEGDKGDTGDDATVTAGDGILVDQGEVSLDTAFTDELYWKLGGNDAAATTVLGTLTDYPLEFVVNGERALRIEPKPDCPNLIGGCSDNSVTDFGHVIGGGGDWNTPQLITTSVYSAIGGGKGNSVNNASHVTIGGGRYNQVLVSGDCGTIGGGDSNIVGNGSNATVAGGKSNSATERGATVCGGDDNTASNERATVCGGEYNVASGQYSFVAGGENNTAAGHHSFAAGSDAEAIHNGTFVWSDSNTSYDVASTAANQWIAQASGGVWFYSNSTMSAGVTLPPGGGAWQSISDRSAKDNFKPVQATEILERLATVPIETWNYKSQDPSIRHIGPMAQDFYDAFDVGEDDRHITTIDADGVALAAIQGLHQLLQQKERVIAGQGERIDRLEERLATLEHAMNKAAGAKMRD